MTAIEAMELFNLVALGRGGELINGEAYNAALATLGEPGKLTIADLRSGLLADLQSRDAGERLPELSAELKHLGLSGLDRRYLNNLQLGVIIGAVYVVTEADSNGLALIGRETVSLINHQILPAWGPYTMLGKGLVVTANLHDKAVAYVTTLDVLGEQRSKGGRKAKYDWPLVVQLAVREVAGKHYSDDPLPTPAELSASVAERYLDETGHDLSDRNSDIRKYCAAVLKGLED